MPRHRQPAKPNRQHRRPTNKPAGRLKIMKGRFVGAALFAGVALSGYRPVRIAIGGAKACSIEARNTLIC